MYKFKLEDHFKVATYSEVKDFGRNQYNRKVKSSHVNDFYDICKNYKGEGLVYSIIPIIINLITGNILDGQNRLDGYIKAVEHGDISPETPILIAFETIEDEAMEKKRIIDLNCKTKVWTNEDYYESYSKTNDNYDKLKMFAENNSLCHKITKDGIKKPAYRYAAAIIKGQNCQDMLKKEEFVVTDEELKTAKKIHDELLAIRNKLELTNDSGIEPMAIEWIKYRDEIDVASFVSSSSYIPASIKNSEKKNNKNWYNIFLIMKDKFPINKKAA